MPHHCFFVIIWLIVIRRQRFCVSLNSSSILFSELRLGLTVANLAGEHPLRPALVYEIREKEVILKYAEKRLKTLPNMEVKNLLLVDAKEWTMQYQEDPAVLVASLYKKRRLTWGEADNLLKRLELRDSESKDKSLLKSFRTHLIRDAKLAVAIIKPSSQKPSSKESSVSDVAPPSEAPSKTSETPSQIDRASQQRPGKNGSGVQDTSDGQEQSPHPKLEQFSRSPLWLTGFLSEWSLGLRYDTGGVQEIDQCLNVLLAAWRRQWLSDVEFNERLVTLLATTVSYVGNTITPSMSRKKDTSKVAKSLQRGLREAPSVDSSILRTCLSSGDGLADELTELADWAWNELWKRGKAEAIPYLLAASSAPRWSFSAASRIILDNPAAIRGPQGEVLLKVLERPLTLPQNRTDFVPLFRKVLEQSQGGVHSAVLPLIRLLKDAAVPDVLAEVMVRAIAHTPPLRMFFLLWLYQQEDQHLNSAFTTLLAAKEVVDGDLLAVVAAGQPASSKMESLSLHLSSCLAGAGFSQNSSGLGLLAFMDAEGTNTSREAVTAAWHRVLVDPPLESLQAALRVVVQDARASLEADVERAEKESARVRAEADSFRQEVKKLSAVAGTNQNPQVSSLSYAKDLIGLIDDLDIQQVQSPALKPAHVRTTKLLLATLKRNGMVVMDPMPGDIIPRDEWLIHPDRFRVFADSTDASTLIVAQRGYLIVDVAGREEVFRPVLLDQDS